MASIDTLFSSTSQTKQLNPWSHSSASHVVIYNHLPACPGEIEPFKIHSNNSHEHLKYVWQIATINPSQKSNFLPQNERATPAS